MAASAGAGATWAVARPGGADAGGSQDTAAGLGERDYGWVSAVVAVAAESAIYGGLAAGGVPGGPAGMWPLAVTTIVAAGTADLLGACRQAGPGAAGTGTPGRGSPAWAERLPALPRGARLVLAGLAFAVGGPQAALFAVLGAEVLAMTWMVVTLGRVAPAADALAGTTRARRRPARAGQGGLAVLGQSSDHAAAPAASGSGRRTRVTAVVGVPGPEGTTSVRITTSATASAAVRTGGDSGEPVPVGGVVPAAARTGGDSGEPVPVGGVAGTAGSAQAGSARAGPAWAAGSVAARRNQAGSGAPASAHADPDYQHDQHEPGQQAVGGSTATAGVLALRDDGAAALWAGRLVQGNLIPLPPALAGLIATVMLAGLGLRDLRGFIAMTPPIVMMLAAPGSSHPHDGRFDWLVPALLALAQYVYLGALGFAVAVPGPVVFAACALTALWHASLAAGGAAKGGAGWEVRLFLTGLAVTFGLGTFGYVGLATYLGVLLCRQAAARYQTPVEDDRQ